MSPTYLGVRVKKEYFPRVSGDEPTTHATVTRWTEFSPRERG